MTLVDYVKALRREWFAIALFVVLGAAGGYLVSSHSPTIYQSSTSVLVTSELGGSGSDLVQGSTYVENLVSSYAVLATSEKVLDPVIDELDLDLTSRQLAAKVSADSPLSTVLINISVVDSDPEQAAQIADAVAASLSAAVADVSPTVAGKPAIRITTIQSANVPTAPIAPRNRRNTELGALVGLVLGVAFALTRRTFGSAISEVADVERLTEVPVVGEIVEAKRGTTLPAAVLENSHGPQAESLRGLTANLSFLGVDTGLRSIVVTSASPAEAKSSIATGVSLMLAEATHRVLLIDADLRAPTIDQLTGLDNTIGLSSVLIGDAGLEGAVQPWGREGLDVLTSGPTAPNPGQLLNSDAMRALIDKASQSYDTVVLDSAPLLAVVDAVWLGHMVDGALVIARRGKTKPRALAKALDILTAARTPVSGVVISRVPRGRRSGYGYTYGHQADTD